MEGVQLVPARAEWTNRLIKISRHCGYRETAWAGNTWCPECGRGLELILLELPRKPAAPRVQHPFAAFERWARS